MSIGASSTQPSPQSSAEPSASGAGPGDSTHPLRSRVLAALVALACIVVAAAGLKLSEPDPGFVDTLTVVGATIELNGGEFTVTKIRAASNLKVQSAETAKTSNLFLVVTAQLAAPRLKTSLGSATLVRGGLTYKDYLGATLSPAPGYVSTADFVFEVDPSRLTGLELQIAQGEIIHGIEARGVVDLGITKANAGRLQAGRGRTLTVQQYPTSAVMP